MEGAEGVKPPGQVHDQVQALLQLRRYEEAAQAVREGLAVQPDDVQLVLLLATALTAMGHWREAVATAERAVALAPNDSAAHRTLGWALVRAGQDPRAVRHFERATSLDPHDATAHLLWGETLVAQAYRARELRWMRNRLAGRADRRADEVIRLNPTVAAGFLLRGRACVVRRDADGAERWLRQALSVEPSNPDAHKVAGLVAELRGATGRAADHFVDAGRLDPRDRSPIGLIHRLGDGPLNAWSRGGGAQLLLLLKVAVIGGMAALAVHLPAPDEGLGGPMGFMVGTAAFLYLQLVAPRRRARRTLSARARGVVDRDRELHRRPRWLVRR